MSTWLAKYGTYEEELTGSVYGANFVNLATHYQITKQWNSFSHTPTHSGGTYATAILPQAKVGMMCSVKNFANGDTMHVIPFPGDSITDNTGTVISIVPGFTVLFVAGESGDWKVIQ